MAGPAAGARQQQGLGSFGAESFSLAVFTWLGNLAVLYFLPEMFASAGLKAVNGDCSVLAVSSLFSGPSDLCNGHLVHMEGISVCHFPGNARRAGFGLSCQKEVSQMFLLSLCLLHSLLDIRV